MTDSASYDTNPQQTIPFCLSDYDKNNLVQLLNRSVVQNKALQEEVFYLKSHIQQLQSQKEHLLDMLESLERLHEQQQQPNNNLYPEQDWQRKYMKLSAQTNESIKQAADLAAEYNKNLLIFREDKATIENMNNTLCQQLSRLKGENEYLLRQLAQKQEYYEEIQSRLQAELAIHLQLDQQLHFTRQKYEQVKRLTRQIVARYEVVEQKCISLEQERGRLSQIGKQYKRKVQQLQKSLNQDMIAIRNEAVEEILSAQSQFGDPQKLSEVLRERTRQNEALQCINRELSQKLFKQSSQMKTYEARCNEIASQIEKFWRMDEIRVKDSRQESQDSQINPLSSQKTLTTNASGCLKDYGKIREICSK